jgi:pyrroloquinoline quinone (PQQ) biosynthesis protein C
LKFADVSAKLFEVLHRHGFSARDLAFFAVHETADLAHGRQALDLVIDRARTPQEQRAAIAAAAAGARQWFDMHGGSAARLPAVAV